jgi:hypothetical protein
MDYKKHFSRCAQGLPAFFPGGVIFTPVKPFNTIGV